MRKDARSAKSGALSSRFARLFASLLHYPNAWNRLEKWRNRAQGLETKKETKTPIKRWNKIIAKSKDEKHSCAEEMPNPRMHVS